ncbi:MAG: tripartite tricarboxylate transporter TctB family protein, partial [Pseudomonadota bacterium]
AVLNYRRDVKAAPVEDATPPDATPDRRRALVNLGGIFAIPLVYAAIIPVIGFYLATPLFLLAELLHLGERRPRQIAMIVIGVCLALCVVFVTLFYVAVPLGREGLFYDLNNAVVLLFRLG